MQQSPPDTAADTADESATDHATSIVSEDLSKAFDRTSVHQCLAILTRMGLPMCVARVLHTFYARLRRVFALQGTISENWTHAATGLVQGCPLSPLLLAGPMCVWALFVQQRCDAVIGIFVDDRTMWSTATAATAAKQLHQAHLAGLEVDREFGFQQNDPKLQLAAASQQHQEALGAAFGVQASDRAKILGLMYTLPGFSGAAIPDDATHRYANRVRRIARASRAKPARIRHWTSMCQPIVTWAGAFGAISATTLASLRSATISAQIGYQPKTAAYTLKLHGALGVQHDVRYAAETALLSMFFRHVRTSAADPFQWLPAVRRVFADHGWTWNAATHTVTWHSTHEDRFFRAGWDSFKVLHRWRTDVALQQSMRGEKRVYTGCHRARSCELAQGLDLPAPPDSDSYPVIDAHRHALDSHTTVSDADTAHRHAAVAGGISVWHRTASEAAKSLITTGPVRRCLCGKLEPSMPHLVWACTATQDLRQRCGIKAPANRAEERLLCRLLPPPPAPAVPTAEAPGAPAAILRWITQATAAQNHTERTFLFATDGGAQDDVSAYGIAAPGSLPIGEATQGEDATSYVAELHAILQLLRGLLVALILRTAGEAVQQRPIVVFVDCQAAIDMLGAALPPTDCYTWYFRVQEARTALQRGGFPCELAWVPAHDRVTPSWRPHPCAPEERQRSLNRMADAAATKALKPQLASHRARWWTKQRAAVAWSSKALQLASEVGTRYSSHFCAAAERATDSAPTSGTQPPASLHPTQVPARSETSDDPTRHGDTAVQATIQLDASPDPTTAHGAAAVQNATQLDFSPAQPDQSSITMAPVTHSSVPSPVAWLPS